MTAGGTPAIVAATMSDKWRDHGLLVIRLGMGAMFVMHGWPKMAGGSKAWTKLGHAMRHLGIDFAPTMWGFAAATSELAGGALPAHQRPGRSP